jgi:predicted DCC family thiol-disulfide oxidoreductase YuxK
MARHAISPPFRLLSMQSEEGKSMLVAHGIDADDPATFLVLDGGQSYRESDGAIHVIVALGGLWRLGRLAKWVPRAWRDALYRLLARNRYRWFGRRAVCYLPDPPPG